MTDSILSKKTRKEIDIWLKKYPADKKQSAVLAALREVQHENNGYLTTELMDAVADYLGMAKIAVYEVASFYSMFETKPVGKRSISICNNISCMLMGAEILSNMLKINLGLKQESQPKTENFF